MKVIHKPLTFANLELNNIFDMFDDVIKIKITPTQSENIYGHFIESVDPNVSVRKLTVKDVVENTPYKAVPESTPFVLGNQLYLRIPDSKCVHVESAKFVWLEPDALVSIVTIEEILVGRVK